jgi:hypothetical protein
MYHTFLPCINISHFYKVDVLFYMLRQSVALQVKGDYQSKQCLLIKFKGNPNQQHNGLHASDLLLPLRGAFRFVPTFFLTNNKA